ncbi:MAG TPA: hypothetical protein VFH56_14165 [Acidimicrobiales bacterium]|nr:hypothetical protein [Acidimicrobiales bacterium]
MDEFETFTIPGRKARRIDWLITGIGFVKDATEVVASTLEGVQDLLCMHANYLFDREQFAEEAALEMETLLEAPISVPDDYEGEWDDEDE